MRDPAPLLRKAILQAQTFAKNGADADQLQAKLTQYEKEFANLTNQDTTIRRLEQQLQQFESKLEEEVSVSAFFQRQT